MRILATGSPELSGGTTVADSKFSLSLLIKAVDQVTGPLAEINQRVNAATLPVRVLGRSFSALSTESGLPALGESLKGLGSAVSGVGKEALALGAKFAGIAAAAGFGLFHVVRGAVDAGDKLSEMAQRVGLGVDAFASLQFAAAQADIEQEAFNSGMDKFNKALGQAKAGTGPLLEFLKKVGPGLATQVKGAKSTEEALSFMTTAFEKVQDPARRAALASAAFGKSGLQFGQFLGQGSKAIQEQQRRYIELTGSQEDFAKGASDLDNAMRETSTAFLGLQSAAGAALFPALTQLAGALTNVVAGNRANLSKWAADAGKAIGDWVNSGGIERLVTGLKSIGETVGKVIDFFGGFKGAAIAAGLFMGSDLIMSVVKLGGALLNVGATVLPILAKGFLLALPHLVAFGGAIAPLLIAIAPFALAAASLGAAGYEIYKNWQPLKEFFVDLGDSISKVFTKLGGVSGAVKSFASNPFGTVVGAASSVGQSLFGDYESTHRSAFDASKVRSQATSSEAKVSVDFANMPKGARVTTDPKSTADVNTSYGYSMAGP